MSQRLIEPIAPENSTGNNVEYDEHYQQLIHALQPKAEQQFGDIVIEAESIDWNQVYQLSYQILSEKSKDLHVMSYYTQSLIARKGLIGLAEGLHIIYENLQLYWDDIYPKLVDEDGDEDLDYRINALSIFASYDGVLKNIRQAFLIKNGLSHSSFMVKDIEILLDNPNTDQVHYPGGLDRLGLDLKIGLEQQQEHLVSLEKSMNYLRSIKQLYQQHIGYDCIKFDHIEKLLSLIIKYCASSSVENISTESNDISEQILTSDTVSPKTTQVNWGNYTIQSRQDVELLLEKIYIYFETHEPSHPAPLFIRRIQKLLNLNFYEIMQDIHPDSLDHLKLLVGQPLNNEND